MTVVVGVVSADSVTGTVPLLIFVAFAAVVVVVVGGGGVAILLLC